MAYTYTPSFPPPPKDGDATDAIRYLQALYRALVSAFSESGGELDALSESLGPGDMLKSVYDTDNNGVVDSATAAGNADTVDTKHAADFATSGHNHDSDYISVIAAPATSHFPYQTAGGELVDSTYDAADFAAAGHDHDADYISVIASPAANHFPYQTAGGELVDSTYDAADFAAASHAHVPADVTGTAVITNDARLTDARTPTAHAHAGSDVTSGTLDGDRLPALSTTKKGGVPATGAPSGKFLKDNDTWDTPSSGGGLTGFWQKPLSFEAGTLTAVTALVNINSNAYYLGQCTIDNPSSVNVLCQVTSALGGAVWAEVAVWKATPVWGAVSTTFSLRGYADVTGTFVTTGIKSTTVAVTGISLGDHIWIGFGSRGTAGNQFQIRAGLAEPLQTGMHQTTLGRPSTAADPSTGTMGGVTDPVAWFVASFVA